jgi:hypothetical protein
MLLPLRHCHSAACLSRLIPNTYRRSVRANRRRLAKAGLAQSSWARYPLGGSEWRGVARLLPELRRGRRTWKAEHGSAGIDLPL